MDEKGKAELAALLQPMITDAVGVQFQALDKELNKPEELLFGPGKKRLNDVEGDELVGEWMRLFLKNSVGSINRHEAELKMRALCRASWERTEDRFLCEAYAKALSEGTASAGGYLTPVELIAEIIKRAPALSNLAPRVRVMGVISDAGSVGSLATDVTPRWGTAENAQPTVSDPVFGTVTYTTRRLDLLTKVSEELIMDAAVDITSWITDLFAEGMAAERDRVIAIGNTSSSEPQGIASATITQSVSVGTLGYEKLTSIMFALPEKYHPNACWIMGETLVGRCIGLVDDQGQPIFKINSGEGQPNKLINKPICSQVNLPTTDIWFGDLNRGYVIFDRKTLSIRSDNSGDHFDKSQVSIKAQQRYDGKVVLAEAFSRGKNITA